MTPWYLTIQKFWSLKRSTTLPSSNWSGKPAFTLLGGSERTLGKRKRMLPKIQPSMVTVKKTQAIAKADVSKRMNPRRSLAAPAAGLGGGAGFGGAAGAGLAAAAGGAAVTAVSAGLAGSALLLGS